MNPIPSALSHYWSLRDQGVSPDAARAHVRQRFGVVLQSDPLASTAEIAPKFKVGETVAGGYLCDIATILESNGSGWYKIKFSDGSIGSFDLEQDKPRTEFWAGPVHVVGAITGRMSCANPNLSQVSLGYGQDFCKTVVCTAANPQGLLGTA